MNEGHPDKICDQVSDAVLDACLKDDERSRVACETCTKTGMVMIFGEITTNSNVNYEQVIRDALKDIGYDDTAKGLDYKTCNVVVAVEEQSPDIAQSVDATRIEDIGAGDQGIMFGYATDETDSLMPLSHELSTQIGARLTEVRKKGICEWCRPDGKTQVRGKGGRESPTGNSKHVKHECLGVCAGGCVAPTDLAVSAASVVFAAGQDPQDLCFETCQLDLEGSRVAHVFLVFVGRNTVAKGERRTAERTTNELEPHFFGAGVSPRGKITSPPTKRLIDTCGHVHGIR